MAGESVRWLRDDMKLISDYSEIGALSTSPLQTDFFKLIPDSMVQSHSRDRSTMPVECTSFQPSLVYWLLIGEAMREGKFRYSLRALWVLTRLYILPEWRWA